MTAWVFSVKSCLVQLWPLPELRNTEVRLLSAPQQSISTAALDVTAERGRWALSVGGARQPATTFTAEVWWPLLEILLCSCLYI